MTANGNADARVGHQPKDRWSKVIIEPATASHSSAMTFAQLKDMATGFTISATLGPRYHEIMRQLYYSADTLQSFTRTIVARLEGQIAGHLIWIPAAEYAARERASYSIMCRAAPVAGIRITANRLRRKLARAPLGPWQDQQLYFESLAVYAHFQRHGIATALLAHTPKLAVSHACTEICMNTLSDNAPIQALFKKHGFTVHQRRGKYLRMIKSVLSAHSQTEAPAR